MMEFWSRVAKNLMWIINKTEKEADVAKKGR